MEQDGDLDDLAARFIRLWEESWQQLAQDPDVARHWANLFGALGWPASTAVPVDPDDGAHERDNSTQGGPASAAPAPVDGRERVDQLAERVRELEDRVACLTSQRVRPG